MRLNGVEPLTFGLSSQHSANWVIGGLMTAIIYSCNCYLSIINNTT